MFYVYYRVIDDRDISRVYTILKKNVYDTELGRILFQNALAEFIDLHFTKNERWPMSLIQ